MTAGLMLAGQPCAQMLPPVFFLLAALLLVRIVRACGGSPTGAVCGVVFAASVPFLHWTGSVAKNDLAMAFFELAALYCLPALARMRPLRLDPDRRSPCGSGVRD